MSAPFFSLIWNIRGFEAPGRKQQLKEYIRRENVDIVGLQETIKESFLLHELEGLSRHKFAWHWRPASGHSGGILLGVREDTFEVEDMEHGEFFVSMAVTHRRSNLSWEVIIVYGPADHSRSQAFLVELRAKIDRCTTPVVVAGDFNLIRSPEDKSSRRVDIPRMRMFNDCLADLALREITRVGARFTWCNNRIDPVQSVLDRVFVSVEWEMEFPLCTLRAATRIGSDHSPLLLCSGGSTPPRLNRFHFENFWLNQPGFVEAVGYKWERAAESPPRVFNAVDVWHHCTKMARQFMRGWGANLGAEVRLKKDLLLRQIQELDRAADEEGLAAEEWLQRFALEHSLMEIYRGEEVFWRQRSRQNWLLQGDANTAYFHAIANGRRRKCSIPCLWDGDLLLEEAGEITTHIYSFYKGLFAAGPRTGVALAADLWPARAWVSDEENAALTLPFLPTEVRGALEGMKASSAPGPDGLPVVFFQKFWAKLQETIMPMFQEFYVGTLDMGRLNYGVITLIPKVVGATDIRQFRPITVINVIQRLFSKVCAVRLAPVMERITHQYQFAFLKGRHIHDGILALHEIVHEVRSRHQRGVFLKLDFQKAYDRLDWSFLRQVLQRRGVDDRMIGWIMQTVMTGSTAININGEVGPYFRPACGVRQGDPLSPILFNAAVDSLAEILERARISGHITGVVGHLIPGGGVTHLQYADDTMIMFEGSDRDIQNTKFLLLCFEAMSGLKINFDKSEVVVLGYPPEAQQRIADNLNCDGRGTMFWLDPWLGASPICLDFPDLFAICADPPCLVADVAQRGWDILFRRGLTQGEALSLARLRNLLPDALPGGLDSPSWRLSPSGSFSLLRDRLPSGVEVAKRHGPGDGLCPLCAVPETTTHIMFSCPAARFLWSFLQEALGPEWQASVLGEFIEAHANNTGRRRRLFWLVFAALTWTLWTQWYPLCRQRDRERLDGMLEDLLAAARRLSTSSSL
ncbi:hypothetical protein QYE76_024499 [Lolium multiflorum]|uniref:Reverse transcriptase domain-containing protein n=1 Tax=Lolium multiflorum TaxID=4521 RepID=A0AAD8RDF3_LOLMU|nr:hypothetical protein QYE76_024499 [Lolium multiflorum]